MKKVTFVLSILTLVGISVTQAQRGHYREDGALYRRPYTTFFHANRSEAELERQIEAVRKQIMADSFSRTIYTAIIKNANTPNPVIGGHPSSSLSVAAAVSKNAAFVYLLGFDENGANLSDSALNHFKNKANGILNQLNSNHSLDWYEEIAGFDLDAKRLQWRSKELLMYAQAYDLLATANARHNGGITNFSPMEHRLQNFARNLYKYGEWHLERKTNHSLMIASAIGTTAIVLNHMSSQWHKPSYQPVSWANIAHYNFQNAIWTELSGKGGIEGYSEGPYYFNFAFESAAPFFRTMGNFLPHNTERQYSNNRFALKRIHISFFGWFDLIDWTIGPRKAVRNYSYDKSFLHLYDWASHITQPDGLMPTLDDTWANRSFSPIMSLAIHEDTAEFLKERYAFNIPLAGTEQFVDLRADWLASLNPYQKRTGEASKVLPISGDLVLRTPYHSDGTEDAIYLHLSAETGKAMAMGGHEHNDAGAISLKAGENDLIFDPAYEGFGKNIDGMRRNAHSRITNAPLSGYQGIGNVGINNWDFFAIGATLVLAPAVTPYYVLGRAMKEKMDSEYKEGVQANIQIGTLNATWTTIRSDRALLKDRIYQMPGKQTGQCRGEGHTRRVDFMRQRDKHHYVMHDLIDKDLLANLFQWRLNGNGRLTSGSFVDSLTKRRYARWTGNITGTNQQDLWDLHVSVGVAGGQTVFESRDNRHGNFVGNNALHTQLVTTTNNSTASGFLSVLWPYKKNTAVPDIKTTETADHALIAIRNFDLSDSLSNAYVASRNTKTASILNPLSIPGDSSMMRMIADYAMISMAGKQNVAFGECMVNTKFRMAGIENGRLLAYDGDTLIKSNRNVDFSFEMTEKLLFEGYAEVDTFSIISVKLPDFLPDADMRAFQKGTKRSLAKWYNDATGEMIMELYPGYYEFEIRLKDPCLISCFFPNPVIQNHFVFQTGHTAHLGHDLNIIPNLSEPQHGKLSILKGSKMSICPDYGLINQKNLYLEGEYDPLAPGGPGKQLPVWTEYLQENESGGEPELPGDRVERNDTTVSGSVKKSRESSRRSMIIVRHDAALVLDSGSYTVVGPHSTILVRKGGTLLIRSGAIVEIVSKKNGGFGEIIAEDSAYVCAAPGAIVRFVGDTTDTHKDRNVVFVAMMDSSRAQGHSINAKPSVSGISTLSPVERLTLAGKISGSSNSCTAFCSWKTFPGLYEKVANVEYGWSNLNTPKARFYMPDTICWLQDWVMQARHTLNEADYRIKVNGVEYDTLALYHTIESPYLPDLFTPILDFVPDSSYLVELWVRNDCGQRDSIQKVVYFAPMPQSIVAVTDSCPGYGGVTAVAQSQGAVRHEWRIAPLASQGALDTCRLRGNDCPDERTYTIEGKPDTSFSFPGYRFIGGFEYIVELQVWDNCGRSATDTTYFACMPAANIHTNDTTILGASVPFIIRGASSTGNAEWHRISPSPKNFTTLPNITDTLAWSASLQNKYIYVLRDNAGGCTASDTVSIQLNNLADAGPDRYICRGGTDEPILGTEYNMDTTLYDYEWAPTEGLTRSPNRYGTRAKPAASTLYTLKVKQKNTQNVLETDQVWVYVQDSIPGIILRHYAKGTTTCFIIEEPDTLAKNFTYLWEAKNHNDASWDTLTYQPSNCFGLSQYADENGYDTVDVCLTLTNTCGSFKQCKQIVFSDRIAQGFRKEATVEALKVIDFAPTLLLYPNPSSGRVQAAVNLPESIQMANLILYNSQGTEVGQYQIFNPRSVLEIDAHHLPSGLYHCVLRADGINITSVKLIIE